MNFLKDLSTSYYKDARRLNYTWMDLVKKTTREKVIDDVRLFKNIKIMNKSKQDKIKSKQLKMMEDEVKREHFKIIKPKIKIEQLTKALKGHEIKIEQLAKALKGHVEFFKISVINNKDPLLQLQKTRKATTS